MIFQILFLWQALADFARFKLVLNNAKINLCLCHTVELLIKRAGRHCGRLFFGQRALMVCQDYIIHPP